MLLKAENMMLMSLFETSIVGFMAHGHVYKIYEEIILSENSMLFFFRPLLYFL